MDLHITLQSKGGVGKSFVSYLLAQYLTDRDEFPMCVDLDPNNNTLSQFKSLKCEFINILDSDDPDDSTQVNTAKFDDFGNLLLKSEIDCVADCGATTFNPITNYLLKNKTFTVLKDFGVDTYIHTVVCGGDMFVPTMDALGWLLDHFSNSSKIVVWLNQANGKIESEGKTFEQFKVYTENKEMFYGIIPIPKLDMEFGKAVDLMLSRYQTFKEFYEDEKIDLWKRNRTKIFKEKVYDKISLVIK